MPIIQKLNKEEIRLWLRMLASLECCSVERTSFKLRTGKVFINYFNEVSFFLAWLILKEILLLLSKKAPRPEDKSLMGNVHHYYHHCNCHYRWGKDATCYILSERGNACLHVLYKSDNLVEGRLSVSH